jgi:hypothetical protein
MASHELGASLAGPLIDELAGWCSLWADILQVRMTLHAREHLVDEPANLFARRSLWEAAVVAYGRTAANGRRPQRIADLLSMLTTDARECHEEVMKWRNQHVAHRVDEGREQVEVKAILDTKQQTVKRVDISVMPILGPEEEGSDFADRFEWHVTALGEVCWQERIRPLESRIIAEQTPNIQSLLGKASTSSLQPLRRFAINFSPSDEPHSP